MNDVCNKLDQFVSENMLYNLMIQIDSDSQDYRIKTHCFSHNTYPEYDLLATIPANAGYNVRSLAVDLQIIHNWSHTNNFHIQFMIVDGVVLRVVLHRNRSDIIKEKPDDYITKVIDFISPDYFISKMLFMTLVVGIPITYLYDRYIK